ncbi:Ribonuclease H-like superfamily [Sesbania bispinosa]|nr:Ribonuclease H-like superfamily [Sesbania bispinosa]
MLTITRANTLCNNPTINEHEVRVSSRNTSSHQSSKAWRRPRADAVKINCDAAFNSDLQTAALASIARDSSGAILAVSSRVSPASSPLIAEALAVREGVLLASATPWPKILIESDNQQVIEAIRGGTQQWAINQIVRDTITSSRFLPFCGFLWTNREGNNLAHVLAQLTMASGSPFRLVSSLPPAVLEIAASDASQSSELRGVF